MYCSTGGQLLDAGRVRGARRAEFAHMSDMGVGSEARRSQLPRGARVIKTHWVDNERVGDQVRCNFVRSRLVRMEFKIVGARGDIFAGIPPVGSQADHQLG